MTQEFKQKAETFLIAYFLKIQLYDKVIQNKVTSIFVPVVALIMQLPEDERIDIFKYLLTVISHYVGVLQAKNKTTVASGEEIFSAIASLIVTLFTHKTARSRHKVDSLLYTVFIEDLVCDIGVLITQYKKARSVKKRELIKAEIDSLLLDYNEINVCDLTFKDIICEGLKK